MRLTKRYFIFISIVLFFLSCGNQEYKKSDIKLLKKYPESTLKEKIEEPKEVEQNSTLQKDTNETNLTEVKEVLHEENSSINTGLDLNSSEDKNDTNISVIQAVDINLSKEDIVEENLSLVAPLPKVDNSKISKVKIVEPSEIEDLKAIVEKELKLLSKKSELSKSLELNITKSQILAKKEIALAKLSTQKEIARAEFYNKKELSAMELENKHKLELAKLQATKEIDKIKLAKEKEVAMAKLEHEKEISSSRDKVNLSKELHKKEVELAKLKTQEKISENDKKVAITQLSKEKEVELAKLESQKELSDKDMAFKKMVLLIVSGIVLFVILMIYLINKRKRDNELKMHENELRHKEYMEASSQQNEHIKKILEIITDENADKGIKKEMVKLLKEQGKNRNLIEYKK